MAVLVEHGSRREVRLLDRHTVGRSRVCDLVLTGRDVSAQHAEIQWTGGGWELHDLGSRNGTYLGAVRLAAGARTSISQGAHLRFGSESTVWELADASGPQAMAHDLATGAWCVADGGYLAVPTADNPEFCIYQESDGVWLAEHGGRSSVVDDRVELATSVGGPWRLHLPRAIPGTWRADAAPMLIVELDLRFTFSRDEEHVELVAHHGERRIDMQARAHHYPLLLLARRRLADRSSGAPEPDCGWVRHRDLASQLRIDEKHLDITIHRARSHFSKHGVTDAAALIERRYGTGQMRIGCRRIELIPLEPGPRRA